MYVYFFFFQAEDGIRDYDVTGVQTCALPIWKVYKFDANTGAMRNTHMHTQVGVTQCAREDSNLHGILLPPAPQADASANSATRAKGDAELYQGQVISS